MAQLENQKEFGYATMWEDQGIIWSSHAKFQEFIMHRDQDMNL